MGERVHVYPSPNGSGYTASAVDRKIRDSFGATYEEALADFDMKLSRDEEGVSTHVVHFAPAYLRGTSGGTA